MGRQPGERPQGLGSDECHCDVPNDNTSTILSDKNISFNTSSDDISVNTSSNNSNNFFCNFHRVFHNSHD